jgi:hypothetical protein
MPPLFISPLYASREGEILSLGREGQSAETLVSGHRVPLTAIASQLFSFSTAVNDLLVDSHSMETSREASKDFVEEG